MLVLFILLSKNFLEYFLKIIVSCLCKIYTENLTNLSLQQYQFNYNSGQRQNFNVCHTNITRNLVEAIKLNDFDATMYVTDYLLFG